MSFCRKTTQCGKFIKDPYSLMNRLFSLLFFVLFSFAFLCFALLPFVFLCFPLFLVLLLLLLLSFAILCFFCFLRYPLLFALLSLLSLLCSSFLMHNKKIANFVLAPSLTIIIIDIFLNQIFWELFLLKQTVCFNLSNLK